MRLHPIALVALSLPAVAAPPTPQQAAACHGQVPLPLTIERTGHVSVQLTVNGTEARLLVDTGANVNTLDITEGKRLKPTVIPSAESSPGEGRASMKVSAGSVELGSQEFSVMDLHFINIPSKRYGTEPFVGQLGAKFFTDYTSKIDFRNMVLCVSIPQQGS